MVFNSNNLTEHRDYESWLSVQEGLFARFDALNKDRSRLKDSSSWMKMPGTVAYKPTYSAEGWRATVTYRLDTEARTDGQKLVKSFPSAPKKERSGLVTVVGAPTKWKNDPKDVASKGRRPAALSEIGFQ